MSYHIAEIPKGKYGEFSKIVEEYHELLDANNQNNPILELVELSDLAGAIEEYAQRTYNISLKQIIEMSNLTKKAFASGRR